MSQAERKAYWSVIRRLFPLLFVLLIFALWSTLAWASQIVPFTPYSIDRYSIRPPTVCQGETVDTILTHDVKPGYGVYEADVTISWRQVLSNGELSRVGYDLQEYTIPLEVTDGMDTIVSPIAKEPPLEPGEWRVRSRIEVKGAVFLGLFGTTQTVTVLSEDEITVLPIDHPDCALRAIIKEG